MQIDKYKNPDGTSHFLLLTPGDELPADLGVKRIKEKISIKDLSEADLLLPIVDHKDLFLDMVKVDRGNGRTNDSILFENRIDSITALVDEYYLISKRASKLSKRLREIVVEKYENILRCESETPEDGNKENDGAGIEIPLGDVSSAFKPSEVEILED